MAKPIIMPQVGQDIETAVIVEWRVRENDRVRTGDILFVVESDKAVFEIEAVEPGIILKVLCGEGETAKVFDTIAYLGEPGETINEIQEPLHTLFGHDNGNPIDRRKLRAEESTGEEHDRATPSARRVARERGIELSAIRGSGPDGRVIREDVLRAVENQAAAEKTAKPGENKSIVSEYTTVEITGRRKVLADRLTRSKRTIPHFYLAADVDMTAVLDARIAYNRTADMRVSVNDIIMLVTARTLRKFPRLNAHVVDGTVTIHDRIHIGFAVSHDDELFVPVITDADRRTVGEIAGQTREMIQNARSSAVKTGGAGTFTLSNLSMYPIRYVLPIINPPECAILGVGGIQKRVVPDRDNNCTVRSMATLTIACDHRAIDGVYASRFLKALKRDLETVNLEPET